ncbi:MAG: triacylglycerol lipase, partial [Mycobacterium sp.]|nr:triacylglycerol lipase [Mycobacterium sp.]
SVLRAGEVRRTRSGVPGVVVATGGPQTSSPTGSPESAARITAAAESASTTPNANARQTVRAGYRKGSTTAIGPVQPNTAASASGSTTARNASTSDAVQPSTSTTPPYASTLGAGSPAVSIPGAALAAVQEPPAEPAATVSTPTPVEIVSGIVPTQVSAVLSPFANNPPTTPVEPPTMWTLLAFVRREFESTVSNESPTVDPLAGQITNGLVTDTPTLDDQSIYPAITGVTAAPLAGVSDLTSLTQLNAAAAPATFTGQPSFVSQVITGFYRVQGAVGDAVGVDLATPLLQLLSSDSPPWFTTLGLSVQRSEFEGMPVWTLQAPGSTSEKTVVAIPGSAFIVPPTLFHWLNYAAMASNTGATVIVPIYPRVPQAGTAGTVVPAIADLISSQIDQHGAENVSVYGDSLGGTIGLAAVQELVRRGDSVPSHMVLISPALDLTFSNPAIQFVDDPVFSGLFFSNVRERAQLWAGDLDVTDPLVSPLFGSLAGLPPTALYFGSLEILAPDGLVLQDKALATLGADFTFILRKGELHIWAVNTILPETIAVLPDIYQQLGLIGSEA